MCVAAYECVLYIMPACADKCGSGSNVVPGGCFSFKQGVQERHTYCISYDL